MNSTTSEIRERGTRGRRPDPNKLQFVSLGLRPAQREWLRRWRSNPDQEPPAPGSEDDNPTQQLQMLIDYAMRFFPDGNAFHSWPRDEKGRFAVRQKGEGE
jgi:hypothetical protein